MKSYIFYSFLVIALLFTSCKSSKPVKTRHQIQKTIASHQPSFRFLIKDSSIYQKINQNKRKTTYKFRDSIYSLSNKDNQQWQASFSCPTPTRSFWFYGEECIKQKSFTPLPSLLPLKGIKIALDAGHLAGTPEMAEIEGKKIHLLHPETKDSIFFYEGELTFLTVTHLKEQLTELGADVFVTRRANESAFGYSYFDWLDKRFFKDLDSCLINKRISIELATLLLKEKDKKTVLSKKIIFHKFFKQLDFYQRAKIINQYQPDITVIVHYNVDVNNKKWETPSFQNFSMAFVPGAFMKGEIHNQLNFNHFVRLSQTNEIKESIILSKFLLNGLKKYTKVDIIEDFREIGYLNNYCIATDSKGVFARNLALTRQVKGTLCYIEALYQDNFNESLLLNKNTNNYFPQRVKEVAQGLTEGIVTYFKQQPK